MVKSVSKKIEIKALPDFKYMRWITLKGISKKDFRLLQSGKATYIDVKYFLSNIMKELKNGND